jgi:recombination protein RecA
MNNKQKREIIFACCLGDGCICKTKINTLSLAIHHGAKQEDYLRWKTELINSTKSFNSFATIQTRLNKLNDKTFVEYMSRWNDTKNLRLYYKRLYSNNKKHVNNALQYMLSPISLAIWFMDDGSVFKRKKKHKDGSQYYLRPSLKLCTHSFSKGDNEIILKWLKDNFDIEGYIVIERKRNREGQPEYFTLNFNCDNTLKIWNIIKEYIVKIPSMQNKFSFIEEYYRSE